MPDRSSPSQRQQKILAELLERGGSISTARISEMFGVSLMTAHRDLDALEKLGLARKFHGGATALPASMFDVSVEFRSRSQVQQKAAIARVARSFVEPGMSLLLEDSTTNLALAEDLGDITPLTVITNFPRIAKTFAESVDVKLIMLGGEYSVSRDAYSGLHCVQAVSAIRASIYFSSTAAMSLSQAYHSDPDVVMVKRAMMQAADRKVLMMDSSKIGTTALHVIGELTEFDDLVVGPSMDRQTLAQLKAAHPRVWVAPRPDRRRLPR